MSDCNMCEREHVCDYQYKPCDCVHYRKFVSAPTKECTGCKGGGWSPYPIRCMACNGYGQVRSQPANT